MASADALSLDMMSLSLTGISSKAYPCCLRGVPCATRRVANKWLVMRSCLSISSSNCSSMGRSLGGLVGLPARKGASLFLSRLKERFAWRGVGLRVPAPVSRSLSFDKDSEVVTHRLKSVLRPAEASDTKTVPYQGEGPANLSPTFWGVGR